MERARGKCTLAGVAACCLARGLLAPERPNLVFVPSAGQVSGAALHGVYVDAAVAPAAVAPLSQPAGGSDLLATVTAAAAAGLACGAASRCRQLDSRISRAAKKGGKGGGGAAGGKKGGGKRGGGGGDDAGGDEEMPEIDTEELVSEWKDKMEVTKDLLREQLVGIRAGKATPALLDALKINAYESEVKIQEVGTVTATDATTLTINCFDDKVAPAVEKAIRTSDLGYGVQTAGAMLKVTIPELTKDKRVQYIKIAKEQTEKARVAVRNVRAAAKKKVKSLSKQMSDDAASNLNIEIEDMVKAIIGDLDKMCKKKEDELSKV